MVKAAVICAWALAAAPVLAAEQPRYAPPPDWVKPIPIPTDVSAVGAPAVQALLLDNQTRFGAEGDAFFSEFAAKVTSPQGLESLGTLLAVWDPATETLTIHHATIIRGGQTIDLLSGGKTFTALRRETNLELAMLDGRLTATLPTEGLQVGDVLDFAMTLERHDPVYQGRSEGEAQMAGPDRIGRVFFRSIWPDSKRMRWRTTAGLSEPTVVRAGGGMELIYDMSDARTPRPPRDAPVRFGDLGASEVTQFSDWAEVASLAAPLYAKAATLEVGSPLKAEAEKIKAGAADPKVRAAAALHLVEDKVRYFFAGMNATGFIPAAADTTWARRYGDCKGKTALLLALLHELGIEAEPALVNTVMGDGLEQRLPMFASFDHVIVRAVIGGRVYWLDGTRRGDRGLDDIPVPNVGWVLPVRPTGSRLEHLVPPPLTTPGYDRTIRLDARAGLDQPAPAEVSLIYRGDDALRQRLRLEAMSKADADKFQREFWRDQLPWVEVAKVGAVWDEARGEFTFSMQGQATVDWVKNQTVRDLDLQDSSLGWEMNYRREPGPNADAPYVVDYPMFKRWQVVLQLPGRGAGFEILEGASVDRTAAGIEFTRSTLMKDGVMSMEAAERSVAPEFPAGDAPAAAKTLHELNSRDVIVRAGSGYRATLAEDEPEAGEDPTTATGFAARGAVRVRSKDYDGAIADFDQAARLEPSVSKHLYNRGVAHFYKKQDDLALGDFTQALKLKPDDALVLAARGEVYLEKGDEARARADFDDAIRLSPQRPAIAYRVAGDLEQAGKLQAAIRIYDHLLAAAPAEGAVGPYIVRCRLRGEWGRELSEGLADCEAALKLQPTNAAALEARGLLSFRGQRFDQALADFAAALKADSKRATALYVKGLALDALGRKPEGAADKAAALAIDPGIAAAFARYGLAD